MKSFGPFLAKLWPFLYIMTSSDKSADVSKNNDVIGKIKIANCFSNVTL